MAITNTTVSVSSAVCPVPPVPAATKSPANVTVSSSFFLFSFFLKEENQEIIKGATIQKYFVDAGLHHSRNTKLSGICIHAAELHNPG